MMSVGINSHLISSSLEMENEHNGGGKKARM